MPEGPTLHRLARLHRRRFAGHPVAVSSPQGRFAAGAAMVDGRVLVSAEAYGKHLSTSTVPTSWFTCTSGCTERSATSRCRLPSRSGSCGCG